MKYIEGDLLQLAKEGKFDIIIHGCNCFNTMGLGIALQIKQQFPEVYETDCLTNRGDSEKLGNFTSEMVVRKDNVFMVCNAYTQYDFRRTNDKINVDYDAIKSSLERIKNEYSLGKGSKVRVGIPQIGCGLAGGNWSIIEDIIDNIAFNDITCVIYEK